MKKLRFFCVILCMSLILGSVGLRSASVADGVKSEIPYADKRDTKTSPYWYKEMKIYGHDDAAEAGVPFGYSGFVMKLVDDTSAGITVDFSSRHIPVSTVKALHMRVYYGEKQREVRITVDAGVSWVMRYVAAKPGQWDDVVLSDPNELKKLANDDGTLGIFGFGFRNYDGTRNSTVYIDEIVAELKEGDKIPPALSYDGPDVIKTTEGKPFSIPVTAWDEQEKAYFPIRYVWDKEAVDGDGKLVKGEYELTLSATDSYGNTSEKKLKVSVGDRDVTPPVISFTCKQIRTVAGAYVRLDIGAEDDFDDVTAVNTWSEGAIDRQGRITEGTHTLTVTAADLTGNTATHTVTVIAGKTLE